MIWHSYDIRHVDLASEYPSLERSARPVFAVFWWRALPLGIRIYVPEQLPLRDAELVALTAELASLQLATRATTFGGRARATFDGRPVMSVSIDPEILGNSLLTKLEEMSEAPPASADDLSVIVCTRDRPEALEQCLLRLSAQDNPPAEIVVVDNSASRSAEPVVSHHSGIRYVHEPTPGLSRARNAGIRASCHSLVAFTDDDVEPRSSWTMEIARALSDPTVDAVTGLVLPARLDTPAQCFFQLEMGGLGGGCVPLTFDARFFAETRAHGAQVWRVGAGANMAFRRTVFERVGLFDERLGAGASGCSEDSELWYRLLASDGTCVFEPRACVFHQHREHWGDLRRQMRAYMQGHVSALFVQAERFSDSGNLRRVFLQLPRYFAHTAFCAIRDDGGVPRLQILLDEVSGWLRGLSYGLRQQWRARTLPAALASSADRARQ